MVGFREMKRAILILVIGLFWCSVGFAKVLKFDCKQVNKPDQFDFIKYSLDTDKIW